MPFNKAQIISYWFSSVSFYGLHGQTNRKPQQHPVVLLAVAILVLLMKVKLYLKKKNSLLVDCPQFLNSFTWQRKTQNDT